MLVTARPPVSFRLGRILRRVASNLRVLHNKQEKYLYLLYTPFSFQTGPQLVRPATAVLREGRVRSVHEREARHGTHLRGPFAGGHLDSRDPFRGDRGQQAQAQLAPEDRVRVVRVKPGGGGATIRRSVESGRAACGVRVWSAAAWR